MKFLGLDMQHWSLIVLTPMGSALADYLLNANTTFTKPVMVHAALATLCVGLAVFKAQADKLLAAQDAALAAKPTQPPVPGVQ